ncbi:MAG: Gfo/Idh/MocA family oxidoreductase [Acidimicrobiia bacterium]
MTTRIAVIGSGRRVRTNFMPAFAWLEDRLEVTGIWSRTAAHAEAVAASGRVPARASLADLLAARPEIIAVSVSTAAVPGLLHTLARAAPETTLVLDTPVFGRGRDLHAMRRLPKFRRVLIAEDYMNYPHFELMREVAAAGVIGPVRDVVMQGNGYRYHGLATIRSFYGFPRATVIRRRRPARDAVSLSFRFGATRRGRIEEPYAPREGHITVSGTDGVISDDPTAEGALVVERVEADGEVAALRLAGHELLLPQLAAIRAVSPVGSTLFDDLKTCGLIRVLESIWSRNVNSTYSYREGLYDHLATGIGRRLPTELVPGISPRSRALAPIGR